MPHPTFQIFKGSNNQYFLRLRADNNEILLGSEEYTDKSACSNGIESIRKNALDDTQFERKDATINYRFNLKAGNGEIIASSESYSTAQNRDKAIQVVKTIAPSASVEDLT